jgi:hypothetical protein
MENTSNATSAPKTHFSLRNRKPAPLVVEIANAKNAMDALLLAGEAETETTPTYVPRHAR